jgi:aldehyde dehydrogenase (NAD+)
VEKAQQTFVAWGNKPAPERGQLIRDLGNAVRELKEPLEDLICLEMGKIRAEGHGEVQEMIDICDFAVGLSRQLYGLTMQSERPGHRMYEQWHPIGPIELSRPSIFRWLCGHGTRRLQPFVAIQISGNHRSRLL